MSGYPSFMPVSSVAKLLDTMSSISPILIDGAQGEGGGQILRTSLALSLVTQKPFTISNIRANRDKPGLMRQHLTAVNAAATIGGAQVQGAEIGSRQLTFRPGPVMAGEYRFSIATAGSTTLVLQTILPPLLLANGPSTLHFTGGTHNPFAPPYDFVAKAFLPLVNRMGPRIESRLECPGFYPAGGGKFSVTITPAPRLAPLHLVDRGPLRHRVARALVAGVPATVAQRELAVVARKMSWPPESLIIDEQPPTCGSGNVLTLEIAHENVTEVFTGFGRIGIRAEAVAERATDDALRYIKTTAPVGECLADQLLLPLALAGGGAFRTLPLSRHSHTNMDIIQRFVDVKFAFEEHDDGTVTVSP